eukprot:Opistho-1_new@2796
MFKLILSFFVCLFSFGVIANAQTCTGALGDPVINIDFGRGTNKFGTAIPETNYTYVAATPNDGFYTIVQNTANLNSGWHQNVVNHTPNDPNGYFMLVNANQNKGVFYKTTITGLCPNTTYEFAAWIINLLINEGIKPNVKFTIENDGLLIKAPFTTGDINEGSATNWIKYGTIFVTPPNVGTITLTMSNENPGGIGNDLGLDDITFRACGPSITSSINNASPNASICEGNAGQFNLSANVSSGYNDPVYQWQQQVNASWIDLVGQNSTQTTVNFTNAVVNTYNYRLKVAERQNINSSNCSIFSPLFTITVNPKPTVLAGNSGPKCEGENLQLTASGGVTYKWTGPGFTSDEQNPLLTNVNLSMAGTYSVTVTSANGCQNTTQTVVNVLPALNAATSFAQQNICAGESIELVASGGTKYTWSPATSLSDPNIANPIATPLQTTTYTVTVENGACSDTKNIIVNVIQKPIVNAGDDQTIIAGQSATLNGNYVGVNATYSWSPTTYLDDPTKLNPVATPPTDITYKLTVQTNCTTVDDEIFIKVYPKIEIANAFTPNGDGINDTWGIPAMSAFEKPKLTVINRNGQKVYESNKASQWDGKFNGQDLPVGAYYYTLYLNQDFKRYSGWVFITR